MGCDWELKIQVFHRDRWVTIVWVGTKTSTGGGHLMLSAQEIYRQGIKGKYRSTDPILNEKEVDPIAFIIAAPFDKKEKAAAAAGGGEAAAGDKKAADQQEEAGDQEEKEDYTITAHVTEESGDASYMFYSKEQFRSFVRSCKQNLPARCPPDFYSTLLTPMLDWCDMALSAAPYHKEIWIEPEPDEVQQVVRKLQQAQEDLATAHRNHIDELLGDRCPIVVIDQVAPFCSPRGSDVRVAVRDCEGWYEGVLSGDVPATAPQMPPGCPTM